MFQTTNARHTTQPSRLCAHLFHSIRRNGTHGTRTTQQKKTHAQESARKEEKKRENQNSDDTEPITSAEMYKYDKIAATRSLAHTLTPYR